MSARRMLAWGALALVGWAGLAVALVVSPSRALHAYLAAFVFAATISLGALCLVLIAHTTNARWFTAVRRLAEAVAAPLPLLVPLLLPVLLGARRLYSWTDPARLAPLERHAVLARGAWMTLPFFTVRSLFYVLAWSALAGALLAWSARQDRAPERAPVARAVALSAGGLMLFGFTVTFAAFDWLMSLAPAWQSTIFGLYVFAGGMVGGIGALLVVARALAGPAVEGAPPRVVVTPAHVHALGRLLLTFLCFWAYMAYSQAMLVWIADLPHEVPWYLVRWRAGWSWVVVLLVVGHFAAPFLLLLSRPLKRRLTAMALLGAWLVLLHAVDCFWLVIPALAGARPVPSWMDLAALLAVGAPCVLAAALWLRGRQRVPVGDPRLPLALEYESR